MDFASFPGAGNPERNGQKRENQAQNRPSGAVGEVHKFPHKPARTRDNAHQRTKKIPNSDELGIVYWWRMAPRSTPGYKPELDEPGLADCSALGLVQMGHLESNST